MLNFVTREEIVAASPEALWAAITEADQVARWFGDTAEIDLRVGGAVRFTWPAGEVSKGVVTIVDPGVRFGFDWDVFGSIVDPSAFTHVEFRLHPVEGGTSVRVVETGLETLHETGVAPDLEDLFEEHIDGWRNEMSDLVDYVQGTVRLVEPAMDDAVAQD